MIDLFRKFPSSLSFDKIEIFVFKTLFHFVSNFHQRMALQLFMEKPKRKKSSHWEIEKLV